MPARHRSVAAGIFFAALALYLLTYVGAFRLNDERVLFAALDSFLKRGDFSANPIYWDYTNVGVLTTDGEMVPNYEPGQILLPAPLYIVGALLGARVQAVMLWGPLVSALGVALIYLTMIELGYGRRAALLAALIFGAGTIVWPYSKSYYRDPLAMVASQGAIYALLHYRRAAGTGWHWTAAAAVGYGIALLTKDVSGVVLALPLLILLVEAVRRRRDGWRSRAIALGAALVPLLLCLWLYRLYHDQTLANVETFSRNVATAITNAQLSSSDASRMVRAALGLTISPFRGLFFYSPALLLALGACWASLRRHRWVTIALILLCTIQLLGYSRYNYWSGGAAYGSRYMLGVIPALVLLAGPVWEWLAEGRWRAQRGGQVAAAAVGLTVTVSVLFQLPGVLGDMVTFEHRYFQAVAPRYGGIGEAIDATYLSPASSTLLGNARLLLSGDMPLDVAWRPLLLEGQQGFRPALLALLLANGALAGAGLWWMLGRGRGRRVIAGLSAAALGTMAGLLLLVRTGDARFDPYGVDRFLQPMLPTISGLGCQWQLDQPTRCAGTTVIPDPLLTDYFLTRLDGPAPWYALSQPPAAEDEALLVQLAARYPTIYLVRDRSAQADDEQERQQVERLLSQLAFKVDEQPVEGWARLIRFSGAGRPVEHLAQPQQLGEFRLSEATLRLEEAWATPPRAGPPDTSPLQPLDDGLVAADTGQMLQIALRWQVERAPQANYTVFIHLVGPDGKVVMQRDRAPGDGLFPTAAAPVGSTISDNLAIPLDLATGRYRLVVGLYNPSMAGAPRLSGPSGDAIFLADLVVTNPWEQRP